jgi:plasmid stabilization system protein ParE
MTVRYTRDALRELDSILDYIESRSPNGARRVKARVGDLVEFAHERPLAGRLTTAGLRRILANPYPYLLYYAVEPDGIVVVGVRHAARRDRASTRR